MSAAASFTPRHLPRRFRLLLPPLMLAAFFTEFKLLSGLENNLGPFEIGAMALTFLVLLELAGRARPMELHPVISIFAAILAAAAISQINLPSGHLRWGLIEVAILTEALVVLVAFYQLVRLYSLHPVWVLRLICLAVAVVGLWVVWDARATGGDIGAVGPFRNRAHAANYMLTGFWMSLAYLLAPGLRRFERLAGYAAVFLALYAVLTSGRRSVYLALFVGLAILVVAVGLARSGDRGRFLRRVAASLGVVGVLFFAAPEVIPKADFFQKRVRMIGEALEGALGTSEEHELDKSFVALQREGAIRAFADRPLLGIGWGGFYRSTYSPTGHEIHSTPLKFMAELGLVGVLLYTGLMGYLLIGSLRLALAMRGSPYGNVYLALSVAIWSMSLSYLYNRHWSERAFWLFLVVFMGFEQFARIWQRVHSPAAARGPAAPRGPVGAGRLPAPARRIRVLGARRTAGETGSAPLPGAPHTT